MPTLTPVFPLGEGIGEAAQAPRPDHGPNAYLMSSSCKEMENKMAKEKMATQPSRQGHFQKLGEEWKERFLSVLTIFHVHAQCWHDVRLP